MKTTRREERLFWKSQKYRDSWIKAEIRGLHKVLKEREKQFKEYNEAQKLRNAGLNNERAESREKDATYANKDRVEMIADRQRLNEGRSSGFSSVGLTLDRVITILLAIAVIVIMLVKK